MTRLDPALARYTPGVDTCEVQCPYCMEIVELYVDPDTAGQLVEDCAICCRPWAVTVFRESDGQLAVSVTRAQ